MRTVSLLHGKWWMWSVMAVVIALTMAASVARAQTASATPHEETIQEYAGRCDAAIGLSVPDFDCDAATFTSVPVTHLQTFGADAQPPVSCDRPSHLAKEGSGLNPCDTTTRFSVLARNEHAVVVALCRKQGRTGGLYKDVAAIQYNLKNGAACFYQAFEMDHKVAAPKTRDSLFTRNPWPVPHTKLNVVGTCVQCHDVTPIIRAPFLSQISGRNTLPGTEALEANVTAFNKTTPYNFVGLASSDWAGFSVISRPFKASTQSHEDNACIGCHRLGFSVFGTHFGKIDGTAMRLGPQSVQLQTDYAKNANSVDSPLWMPKNLIAQEDGSLSWRYSTTTSPFYQQAAAHMRDCARRGFDRLVANFGAPLLNEPDCEVRRLTGSPRDFGFDRPGLDLNAPIALTGTLNGKSQVCEQTCAANAQCKAWVLRADASGNGALTCQLKRGVPAKAAAPDRFVISGVKGWEYHTARVSPASLGYQQAELNSDDPGACQQRCLSDASCQAWTYQKPNDDGAPAQCRTSTSLTTLANGGASVASTDWCCVSGAKAMDFDRDRGGSKKLTQPIGMADPAVCKALCTGSCKSWTYVRPGVRGPQAMCYTSIFSSTGTPNGCCVSGLK